MFKNYFITSVRSLIRSAGFSTINIVGLAVGLATFSLIAFYVYSELSFDRYHEKADRIFRIVENLRTENEELFQSTSSPPMGPRFLKDFPEVENYVRFQQRNLLAQRDDISSYERDSFFADSTVFDVFSFELLKGDKKTALREPFSIVLTESMAKKYFGNDDPVGQTMKMGYDNYKVTGVMEDVPENSHFLFSNLISFSTWSRNNKEAEDRAWFMNGFHTYVLLREGSSVDNVRAKMKDFLERNIEKGRMYYEDLPLQSLASIYMAPPRAWENGSRGSMNNVYILSIIAVFILLIACFNYVNLATARASRRLKEVGLRKTLGAVRNQDLGFDKEGVLVVPTNRDTTIVNYLDAFKNELKQVTGVINVAGSTSTPGQAVSNNLAEIEMADGKMSPTNINFIYADHDFLSTYQIEILAGRDFQRDVRSDDTTAYLINETAMKDFGWTPEQALGKRVRGWRNEGKIIGVMKDFHYRSLHAKVDPLMIAMTRNVSRISIRINGENLPTTIGLVQKKWNELAPLLPFDYSFLDIQFDRQYKADQRLGKVAGVFTGLAMFIGCLGLLGLTAFVVERRTKEIGIRKVLGASVPSVVMLISREFIWLIVIALVVATPPTWYLISRWEQNFTLQAAINPLRFLMAGMAVFVVAWITIGILSLRAANANPTKALRAE